MIDSNMRLNVSKMVDREREKGIKEHGQFVDLHHAYGVIQEELKETETELQKARTSFDLFFTDGVMNDDENIALEYIEAVHHYMFRTACEAIQTIAMCQKIQGIYDDDEAEA